MITAVTVYLEESPVEYMHDYFCCDHLVAQEDTGEEKIHSDLMDSSGFFSRDELIDEVVSVLGVRRNTVLLVE